MTPTDDWSAERIGLYTRLSQDRAGATSIQRQDDEARDVIDLKGGVLAREPYSDPDASAWKERVHRPGFDRLLADADAGDVTLVVVWACDRLTRQGEQMETFLKLMRKRGLKLYSVKEGYIDLSNGAIMPKLITWKSEMESERISMRVKSANRRLARAGAPHPGGKQAYGQRRRRRPDGTAVLAVEPDEAEIVREMARRLLAHESLRSIAADLVARGVATSTGGVWRGTNINKLLRQPRLAGLRESEGELVDSSGLIEPVLDVAEWKRVRNLLTDPARNLAQSRAAKHLLTGVLRCGACDARMIASSTRGRRTYRCQGVSVPGACGRVSIDAERLEAWIGEYWVEALDGDHLPAQVVALTSDTREAAEEIATYRLRLDEATHARYVTGDLDDAAYKTVKRDLLAMIGEKESTLRRDRDAEQVAKLVGFGRSTWDGSTSEQRRHLLRLLVDRITVAPLTGKGRFDPSRARVALRS